MERMKNNLDNSYKKKLNAITTFIFDIDGVLTDGKVYVTTEKNLTRVMHTKDGFAIKTAIKKGYNVAIISGAQDENVIRRLKYLKIEDIYIKVDDKLPVYNNYIQEKGLSHEEVLYMGDDIPDIPVLREVGLSAAPKDAVMEVLETVDYISSKPGGETCVRDVIEQVLRVQGNWTFDLTKNETAAN
jgi:3-deoxy-D-manno-octulosonate 8-phosphate phosphatase (KDO 8-P phosphatase)